MENNNITMIMDIKAVESGLKADLLFKNGDFVNMTDTIYAVDMGDLYDQLAVYFHYE